VLKNEDIANKQHSVWGTKIRFQNPALAIVCREAEHRQNIVLHAVVKMVETVVS
jgi:hypothetical protein